MIGYGFSFAIALVASILFTIAVRTAARKFGWVAKPRADRWHRKPTALLGGVAIYFAFVLAFIMNRPPKLHGDMLFLVCASGMFFLGLLDDFLHLKPYTKLVVQIILATLFTTFGLRLHWLPSTVLDQALTIFWLVGITNALNLLDNIDGLAGGVALIASSYLVYFCHVSGQPGAAHLAAAFSGAVLGFLVFNFNPASIFMGDCGSLFVGFFLGGVTLVNNQSGLRRNIIAVLSIPVLLLLLPIVDTALVTLNRKLAGRRVAEGGRDHTSHRLVALGMSERVAVVTLWTVSAAAGAVAVLVRNLSWAVAILLVPVFGLGVLFFLIVVGKAKVYEPVLDEDQVRGRALLPTLADFTYKRRIFEVLNDLLLVVLAYYGAYLLRFDGAMVNPFYGHFLLSLPVIIVVQLGAFLVFDLYRGLWRYTSMSDLLTQLKAVSAGWVVSTLLIGFLFRYEGYSRGVSVIDGLLLLVGIAGSRVSFRMLRTWLARFRSASDGRRVLIYGAGDGGELLLRELQNNRQLGLVPIGFVDDDPQKLGRVIHGIRVFGPLERIQDLADTQRVEEVVISISKLDAGRSEALTLLCQSAGIGCRRMRIALE